MIWGRSPEIVGKLRHDGVQPGRLGPPLPVAIVRPLGLARPRRALDVHLQPLELGHRIGDRIRRPAADVRVELRVVRSARCTCAPPPPPPGPRPSPWPSPCTRSVPSPPPTSSPDPQLCRTAPGSRSQQQVAAAVPKCPCQKSIHGDPNPITAAKKLKAGKPPFLRRGIYEPGRGPHRFQDCRVHGPRTESARPRQPGHPPVTAVPDRTSEPAGPNSQAEIPPANINRCPKRLCVHQKGFVNIADPGKYRYSPSQPPSSSGGPTRVGSGHPARCPHVWPCSREPPQLPSFISVTSVLSRVLAAVGGSTQLLWLALPVFEALLVPIASGGKMASRRCAAKLSALSAAEN